MLVKKALFNTIIMASFALSTPLYANPSNQSSSGGGEKMGGSVRTEASIQYLRSRYGDDPSRWPCDQQVDLGVPVEQVRAGEPPADSDNVRAMRRMRDRAN